ncbi:ParA family protein [Leptospira licerasiae]|uniref:ParA family protein n=1 Tax=Leptospira licerasiae TaxID=447106 RepID=UPI0010838D3B|nr:AAA family ATPase [Leptospira licerasiae]TGM87930.1 ParA family protein [Leptospira licerasiae]
MKPYKVISYAIVNQKGGSTKSSNSAIFARSLAATGKRVLVVDCDPQGGVSSVLGFPVLQEREIRKGLVDILFGEDPILGENVHPTDRSFYSGSIDLIPADYRLDQVFFTTSPFALSQALEPFAKENYDVVILDTPPTMQGITRSAIFFANSIIVPCEISVQALGPTRYTVKSVRENKKEPNVVFIGWKEPEGNGYQARLSREFLEYFEDILLGDLPKNTISISFASEPKKITEALREGIIAKALNILEKAK